MSTLVPQSHKDGNRSAASDALYYAQSEGYFAHSSKQEGNYKEVVPSLKGCLALGPSQGLHCILTLGSLSHFQYQKKTCFVPWGRVKQWAGARREALFRVPEHSACSLEETTESPPPIPSPKPRPHLTPIPSGFLEQLTQDLSP